MYDVKIIQHIGLAGAKSEALVYMLIMRLQLWGARGGGGLVPGLVIPYPCNSWSRYTLSLKVPRMLDLKVRERRVGGGAWGRNLTFPSLFVLITKIFSYIHDRE